MTDSAALDRTHYLFPDDRVTELGISELVYMFTGCLESANVRETPIAVSL